MGDQPREKIPPELQTWMDAQVSVEGLDSPEDQPRLQSLITAMPGVAESSFADGIIAIRYDPERTTQAEICEAIVHAGFTVSAVESAPASPIIDALREQADEPGDN